MSNFFDVDFDKIYPKPSESQFALVFFNDLWLQLHAYNFSLLLTFYGKHRVGKSLAAVLFAYILDPTFEKNLEKRIVYTSQDFLKATNELREKKIKGGAIIKDEAGTSDLSSQRWYEEPAKIINAQLQAIGYLNPFIGFVTQNFSFINTHARKLSQGVFEVTRKSNRYSNVKPFWIESSPWSPGFIHKYPVYYERYNDIVSSRYKINNIKINLPPKDIVDRYEAHSQEYKDNLSVDAALDIDSIVSKQKSEQRKPFKALASMAESIVDKPDDYVVRRKSDKTIKKFDEYLIMHQLEVSLNEAKTIKALAEKKFFA